MAVDKALNAVRFFKKLESIGVDVSVLKEKYGEKIENATFTPNGDFGNAYEGSFLEILLMTLTPFAVKMNELFKEEKRVDKDSLVKVCLLHQIGKAIMMVPNDNEWEVSKLKKIFKYTDDNPSIKTGLMSVWMCQECGINLTMGEIEAMTANDVDPSEPMYRYHSSTMANIIKAASSFTYCQLETK
jgi:hypothetical protein